MPRRTLSLVRENLPELTTDDLTALAAGAPETYYCPTAGVRCFVDYSLRYCNIPTVNPDCA